MSVNNRFANVLVAWAENGHTQAEFARLAGLHPGGVTRMFNGTQRPDPDTLSKILSGIVHEHPQLAHDILEAYLLDDIPAGAAPGGRPWAQLVRVSVDEIGQPRILEGGKVDEFELALARFNHVARTTKHGRNFLLNFDQWSRAGEKERGE